MKFDCDVYFIDNHISASYPKARSGKLTQSVSHIPNDKIKKDRSYSQNNCFQARSRRGGGVRGVSPPNLVKGPLLATKWA